MSGIEILLLGVALSMDAFAVGLTNGMVEPKMPLKKAVLIAAFYGGFQFFMPLVGYYGGSLLAFVVEKIAPWLSFALLAFIGGKMIFDSAFPEESTLKPLAGGAPIVSEKPLGMGRLVAQAFATSIDALAVGVSLLAQETTGSLPFPAALCCLAIGIVTFSLSLFAVAFGKSAGNRFADKAETVGGFILVGIGVKLLLEGIL